MAGRKRALVLTTALLAAACSEDPTYVQPDLSVEFDPATADPDAPPPTAVFDLPVRLERADEAEERAALAAELGVDVPWVPRS